MNRRVWMAVGMFLLAFGSLLAQTDKWAQFSFAGGYGHFPNTYEKSGLLYGADMEVHFNRRVYGSLLVGISRYEGNRAVMVEYPNESISDNLADNRTDMVFAIGPGFDLLTNHIDRFYLTLYGGYVMVRSENEWYEGHVKQFSDDSPNGAVGMGRLGYEHQFGSTFVLGAFVQGGYVGDGLTWGAGLRIGFRLSDFTVKNMSGLFR